MRAISSELRTTNITRLEIESLCINVNIYRLVLRNQTEITCEIVTILIEQILSSPLLLEMGQSLEETFLTQVQFIAFPCMASAIAPVSMQYAELRHANEVSGATTNIA